MKIENDNSQLIIDLPTRAALGREDFLVNSRNENAVYFIDNFQNQKINSGILIGSRGSGKTHLVNVLCSNLDSKKWSFLNPKNENIYDTFSINDLVIIEDIILIQKKMKISYFILLIFLRNLIKPCC